jgi:hypothetical protein
MDGAACLGDGEFKFRVLRDQAGQESIGMFIEGTTKKRKISLCIGVLYVV